ncbi:MAG: isoleucine--tRNA ligase [Lachnospiraceae bacterium]|nr:isoleucine--tRNA ligase [Lachnospiraceae bacterium]
MTYEKVSSDMNFLERENVIEQFWKDNNIVEKSLKQREGCPVYTFYDGPPTANGKPHVGHVLTRVIKDMIPRYRTMKGYYVPRKAGWDTHGLPVELEIEKKIGINGKEQIENYGIEPFVKQCKESVWQYKSMWEEFSSKVGFWVDMKHPYITYENNFIESEWWALKEIFNRGLLYKGFKIVPYCPRCGTPLSSHEVAQGYKTVKEKSAIVKFKKKDEDVFFLVWTTTPWTLPSNTALCVNPDETYVKVKAADGYTYILAEALAPKVLSGLFKKANPDSEENGADYEVLEKYKGSDLENQEYDALYACSKKEAENQKKKSHFVVSDNYVTMSDGTGIVHIAPAFGEDDSRLGRKYDLPYLQFVDGAGNMTEETDFAGIFIKKADPLILDELKSRNQLFSAPKLEHEYPFCWRCDTPLIYYARESWFIKMSEVKDNLIKNNETINWIPETIGKGRFGAWLENVQDWAISRDRYWGTPLNVWKCDDCGELEAIGSIEELKEKGDNVPDDIELHKPYIDKITVKCPHCGKTMHRTPEVIDCWFDSGSMPFAQHHYPFENKEVFNEQFPAQFISEAVDQTRGWFYSLLAISTLLFDKAPYENVIVLGHVLDKDGNKMSKSKGNAVDPMEALNKHGADAIRWYFYENSQPWLPNRFYDDAVTEGQRKFIGTLWNTYAFFVLYANIDEFDASKYSLDKDSLTIMDKWILSRLETLIKEVDDHLENYRITEAARAMEDFTDELSNWYVRRCRERFWAKGMEQDKINAYMTLYTVLTRFIKLAAPMVPFVTETIYQNLVRSIDKDAPESIHFCDYPVSREEFIDKDIEENMNIVLNTVVIGRACRNASGIKTRQPLGKMYVSSDKKLDEFYAEIIKDELNVKEVVWQTDVSEYTMYSFKPQLKTLGPKFGKLIGGIKKALETVDSAKATEELKTHNSVTVNVNGEDITIDAEDLLITMIHKEGFAAESGNGITVVFDTQLTEDLLEEGYIREIVSKIQTMRKDAGFEVMDRINVYAYGDSDFEVIAKYAKKVADTVLADEIIINDGGTREDIFTKDWKIDDEDITLGVKKV